MTSATHRLLLSLALDEILTLYENNHIDPPWSHVLMLSLDAIMIGTIIWCVLQIVGAKQAAEQAKRIEGAAKPLYSGARFVTGIVERAEGSTTAVRVTITQQGTETQTKNGHTHKWTETGREVEATPFYLRQPNGARIRVEPPVDVMLVDKLDQLEWYLHATRRKRAELVPGERAIIEGVLENGHDPESPNAEAGYRGAARLGWIMKPARRGMLISTESLSRRHELRKKAFVRTLITVGMLSILGWSCALPYRARLWRGTNLVANYLGKVSYQARTSKGAMVTRYAVNIEYIDKLGNPHPDRIDIDYLDFAMIPVDRRQMWLRYVPAYPWATALGKSSSVLSLQVILTAVIAGLGIFRAAYAHRYRRWYEGPVVERGNGGLPTPPNIKFVEQTWPVAERSARKHQVREPIDAGLEPEKQPSE